MRLQKVGSFDSPVYVTSPPGDTSRLFVVEQGGKIRVVKGGKTLAKPFLDVTSLITSGGERGLLSMAFAPDYKSSGLFYVYYTNKDGNEQVVEYKRSTDDVADPGSARSLFIQQDPEPNHNGGLLLFGPDKLLYIGIGDGGGAGDQHGAHGNGQNLGTLLGKILRIDPKASGGKPYTIPSEQPVRGKRGAKGRDLQLRPAQPVALLVRQLDRRPDHRRRRPGQGRGDRLHAQGQGAGRELRLARLRGQHALQRRARARRARSSP